MATRKKTERFVRVELLEKCQQEKENLHKIIEALDALVTAEEEEENPHHG